LHAWDSPHALILSIRKSLHQSDPSGAMTMGNAVAPDALAPSTRSSASAASSDSKGIPYLLNCLFVAVHLMQLEVVMILNLCVMQVLARYHAIGCSLSGTPSGGLLPYRRQYCRTGQVEQKALGLGR